MGSRVFNAILVYSLIVAVWLSSSGLSLVAVGVSDELVAATAAATADFPCAGHHCGCVSAEMCRSHCCCFPSQSEPEPEPEPQAPSCHLPAPNQPEPTGDSDAPEDEKQDDEKQESQYRLVIRSAECAGRTAWLLANPLYIPMESRPALELKWPLTAVLTLAANRTPASSSLSPEPPPPRRC